MSDPLTVRFEATRPAGDFVLAVPVASGRVGKDYLPMLDDGAAFAERAARQSRFDGEAGAIADLYLPNGDGVRRVLLVGVGAGDDAGFEKAGGALVAKLLTSGETTLVVDPNSHHEWKGKLARLVYAARLRGWRYDAYRTTMKPRAKPTLREIVVVNAEANDGEDWTRLQALAEGIFLTRELVTEPANIIYPESFVERVRGPLEAAGVEIEVLDDDAMAALGMGSLLAVAQGSARPGRLLAMHWGRNSGLDPVAFVGKGVTFDTGGISIKPAAGMEDMKWDMGGAGAVAGAMLAIAKRQAKAHVIGVCGLVENMPDGKATRPGDVVRSMSGQTIEIINTDAEGRLVLADCVTWVQRTYGVKTIVDLATLTGAMIVSLGHEYGGLFSNDDALAGQIAAAGEAVGDKLWRFPTSEAYDKLIESQIADMKNVGPRQGGSITAAQFIKRFVEEGTRWAHLDIAGMVWASKPATLWDKGATAFGVALLDRFVADALER